MAKRRHSVPLRGSAPGSRLMAAPRRSMAARPWRALCADPRPRRPIKILEAGGPSVQRGLASNLVVPREPASVPQARKVLAARRAISFTSVPSSHGALSRREKGSQIAGGSAGALPHANLGIFRPARARPRSLWRHRADGGRKKLAQADGRIATLASVQSSEISFCAAASQDCGRTRASQAGLD